MQKVRLVPFQQFNKITQSYNQQSFPIFMSSFTPFFDPSMSLFQPNFYPWISLQAWNSGSFMQFFTKNKQVSEEKINSFDFEQKRRNSTAQCSPIEEQYQPDKQIQGFQIEQRKCSGRIQCKGRNDYSNILKAFIHLIKTNPVLKERIKIIISLKQVPLTYERFLMRIRRKFSKGKTYISPKEISIFLKSCSQTTDESEQAIGLLFKIILKNFLSLQYLLCLIKSFKGKKQSRKDLIMKTRQLSKLIFEENLADESN